MNECLYLENDLIRYRHDINGLIIGDVNVMGRFGSLWLSLEAGDLEYSSLPGFSLGHFVGF